MTLYRTRTYIAADFDHDKDAVDQLMKWNDSKHWKMDFSNAHELESCRDSSLYCTIKRSLKRRMSGSKRFVLIVGADTKKVTKGECRYCDSYDSNFPRCIRRFPAGDHFIDNRSYIRFECDLAVKQNLQIIVLYKASQINRNLCPDSVKWIGTHLPLYCGQGQWNYQEVKNAFYDI